MNVLILGLGQYPHGSGVEAAVFFARRGDDVTVTDLKSAKELRRNVARLQRFKNVRFVLGRHDLTDVRRADLIVRNPRVRSDSREMREAMKRGIPIESDVSLFLQSCPARVIGVTGTRGKSTTATLIAEMFKAAGRRVWLGGNILVSPLVFLSRVKPDDLVVLELSSWQLEVLGEKKISPAVAVWTNLMRDHLNTYRGMKEYAQAKAQIFLHQHSGDRIFLPVDRLFDAFARRARGHLTRVGRGSSPSARIVAGTRLKLAGTHNEMNAQFATAVALELGVPVTTIRRVLRTFRGLPDRLEEIATKHGVRYVNDTTATTPDATIAALQTERAHRIHLIFGGADKELQFFEVAQVIKHARITVYLLPGTAHEKIIRAFRHAGVVWMEVRDLRAAFRSMSEKLRRGDVVLLSPGCASFGLFKNEFDRGAQFKKIVRRLV